MNLYERKDGPCSIRTRCSGGSPELSKRAQEAILDTDHTFLVSAAPLWEIAIKQRKRTLTGCEDYLERYSVWHDKWGFAVADMKSEHAVRAGLLPAQHADPFDRMLIAQSQLLGASLVTRDPNIRDIHPNCLW